jgi:hypothetical protein
MQEPHDALLGAKADNVKGRIPDPSMDWQKIKVQDHHWQPCTRLAPICDPMGFRGATKENSFNVHRPELF